MSTYIPNLIPRLNEMMKKMENQEVIKFPVYIGKVNDSIRMWLGNISPMDIESLRMVKNALKTFHLKNKIDNEFTIHVDAGNTIEGSLEDTMLDVAGTFFNHCAPQFEFRIDKRMQSFSGITGYFYLSGTVEGFETKGGDNKLTKLELDSLYYHRETDDVDELLLPSIPF